MSSGMPSSDELLDGDSGEGFLRAIAGTLAPAGEWPKGYVMFGHDLSRRLEMPADSDLTDRR